MGCAKREYPGSKAATSADPEPDAQPRLAATQNRPFVHLGATAAFGEPDQSPNGLEVGGKRTLPCCRGRENWNRQRSEPPMKIPVQVAFEG